MADIDRLLSLVAQLRHPQTGCSWDLQQNFHTLMPFTLEEVYEVIDAIECEDHSHLSEELGDLLFQIVFYAQIASESGLFDMRQIVDGIAAKLIARHPHVFEENDAERPNAEQVVVAWEKRKQQERASKNVTGLLGDIPQALPALQRAHKIQSRMSRVGLDWSNPADVLAQLRCEIDELEDAMQQQDAQACADELGDVLFSCVNLARHLQVDSEICLRKSNNKVARRIAWMEFAMQEKGQVLAGKSLAELDALWQAAKTALRQQTTTS